MAVSTRSASLFHPRSQQRALLACVGASIALHAAMLLAFPELRERSPASPVVLTATLSPSPVRAETPKRAAEPAAPRPRSRPVARPEAAPEVARPAPSPEPAAEPPAARAPEQPASALAEGPADPSPVPAQPAQSWDGMTLQQYRMGLMAFARQFKRYPAQAMERGWEGRVEICITVRPTGAIESARVKTPSGYRILDDQALDMVKRALARTPVPPALLGREFSVDIPVIFELQSG